MAQIENRPARSYTFLARAEWFLFIAASFPTQIVEPFSHLFPPDPNLFAKYLLKSVVGSVILLYLFLIVAVVFDGFRRMFSVRTDVISSFTVNLLKNALRDVVSKRALDLLETVSVVTSDLSIGAQVRGVLHPRIVISGGMLIGLRRQNPYAIITLLHELAHIRHFDGFLPGFVALAIVEACSRVVVLYHQIVMFNYSPWAISASICEAVYILVMFSAIISRISKYREYYADASVIQDLTLVAPYRQLLINSISTPKKPSYSFFHPSLEDRLSEAEKGYPVLAKAWFWKIYWLLNFLISSLQALYFYNLSLNNASLDHESRLDCKSSFELFFGVAILSTIFLAFELIRKPLFFSKQVCWTDELTSMEASAGTVPMINRTGPSPQIASLGLSRENDCSSARKAVHWQPARGPAVDSRLERDLSDSRSDLEIQKTSMSKETANANSLPDQWERNKLATPTVKEIKKGLADEDEERVGNDQTERERRNKTANNKILSGALFLVVGLMIVHSDWSKYSTSTMFFGAFNLLVGLYSKVSAE